MYGKNKSYDKGRFKSSFKQRSNFRDTKKHITCYYCKQDGHVYINCKKRARDLLDGKIEENAMVANEEEDSDKEEPLGDGYESENFLL